MERVSGEEIWNERRMNLSYVGLNHFHTTANNSKFSLRYPVYFDPLVPRLNTERKSVKMLEIFEYTHVVFVALVLIHSMKSRIKPPYFLLPFSSIEMVLIGGSCTWTVRNQSGTKWFTIAGIRTCWMVTFKWTPWRGLCLFGRDAKASVETIKIKSMTNISGIRLVCVWSEMDMEHPLYITLCVPLLKVVLTTPIFASGNSNTKLSEVPLVFSIWRTQREIKITQYISVAFHCQSLQEHSSQFEKKNTSFRKIPF